jgi:hypothetical protein
MAAELLSDEQISELKDAFSLFDRGFNVLKLRIFFCWNQVIQIRVYF